AVISVIDQGPGIPAEARERVWERFYRVLGSEQTGSGLGLSIAQTLVNQHDGLIECTSRPGDTVFTVLLPLQP
ncbi:MAG: ATP-binding protein, partial [Gammaproteobacteria bacterium]